MGIGNLSFFVLADESGGSNRIVHDVVACWHHAAMCDKKIDEVGMIDVMYCPVALRENGLFVFRGGRGRIHD